MPISNEIKKKVQRLVSKVQLKSSPNEVIHDAVVENGDKLDSISEDIQASKQEIINELEETETELSNKIDSISNKIEEPDDALERVFSKLEMIKGEQGEVGPVGPEPSDERLVEIIKPLIPEPIKGEQGIPGESIVGPVGPRGERGEPGKDAEPVDYKLILSKIPKPKDGKDGKNTTPKDVIEALKSAPDSEKLDITHLRNYQQFLPKKGTGYKLTDQRWHGAGSNDAIISFIIDGGGSAITTGIKGDLAIQFNCEIKEVELLADTTGSIVIDLWTTDYTNYPPTVANSITASDKPTITNGIKSKNTTLTGWTTNLVIGNTLRYNIDSASSITRCLISLKVIKK